MRRYVMGLNVLMRDGFVVEPRWYKKMDMLARYGSERMFRHLPELRP